MTYGSHNREIACPVCLGRTYGRITELPFDVGSTEITTSVYGCRQCGSVWRDMPACSQWQLAHFEAASYTSLNLESRSRTRRRPLFDQIHSLVRQSGCGPGRLLDVGCAYGHMLDDFALRGWTCTGVEIVSRLRERLECEGRHQLYAEASEIPTGQTYEAITLIDSLYYQPQPLEYLARLIIHLTPDGVVVLRIANRATAVRFAARWLPPARLNRLLGDQVVALSHRGVCSMAARLGLRLLSVVTTEARSFSPRDAFLWLGYRLLSTLATVTGTCASPGMLYILTRATEGR